MRVLVSGASGGLGPAVMDQFRSEGAEVLGIARSGDGLIQADLTNPAEARRAVEVAGELDVVVHVLGGFAAGGDDEVWGKMLALNLVTAAHLFNEVIPGMQRRGSGALIAIGSRVAMEPVAGLAAYGASKAALVHYIRTLALELRGSGVRANIVLPSTIDTEANRRAMPDADFSTWVHPASIAKVVSWLASTDAADVSGAVVPVYGRA